ncbi:MAG: hypothetical protein IKT33_03985 [Clostridia bacterium]|nr:hypothetical protein [Clostridia bacterium]
MKKLSKLLSRLSKMGLTQEEREVFKTLDLYVEGFFPQTVSILTRLDKLGNKDMKNLLDIRLKKDDGFNLFNMFFRSRDDAWMAQYLAYYYEHNQYTDGQFKATEEKKEKLPLHAVEKYVKFTTKYKALRDEFEQNIVRSYISNWVTYIREDDFYCKGERKKAMVQSENFDHLFRYNVVSAMQFLNIPDENIQAGLERYNNYWRETAMLLSFKNHFKKIFGKEYDFENQDFDLKNYEYKWMIVRNSEYYDQHKDAVNKYGKVNLAMKMPKSKVAEMYRDVLNFEEYFKYTQKQINSENEISYEIE